MKEFDFDELDKAVNSLMSTLPTATQTATKPDDDLKTVTLPSIEEPSPKKLPTEDFEHHNTTSIDDGAPKLDDTADELTLTAAVNDDAPADLKPAPAIAPRRSGRFMDMVHASGDPTKIKKAPSELPSRVGRMVAPSSGAPIVDVMKPNSADSVVPNRGYMGGSSIPAPAQDEPSVNQDSTEESSEATSSSEDTSQLMSMHGSSLTPLNPDTVPEELPHQEASVDDDIAQIADTLTEEQPPSDVASSPFLPDAKVEKRPLGGAGDDAGAGVGVVATEAVPAELSSDLMAIEAGENDTLPVAPPVTEPAPTTPSTPEVVAEPVPAPAEMPLTAAAPSAATPSEPLIESGPISIPQQYQEAPNSGDQSNGAIYDTASYHQPLAHPAKKKSGWWIVLIIIAIVLIGAGAGAFAYFQGYF